jgi:hypothetical protein
MQATFVDLASGNEKEVDLDIDRKTSDKSTTDVSKFKVE